jgi:acyl carrier protein
VKYRLENIDLGDLEDVVIKLEDSFGIQLTGIDLLKINNFGELTDIIKEQIEFKNEESCTSQQAFYKLKKIIEKEFGIENLNPKSELSEIFPKRERLLRIKQIEKKLDFKLKITQPKSILLKIFGYLFITSLLLFIFNYKIAFMVFIASIIGIWTLHKFGKELSINTFGELAEKMKRENYSKVRRNKNSINKNEIEKIIIDTFSIELDIEKSELGRNALI